MGVSFLTNSNIAMEMRGINQIWSVKLKFTHIARRLKFTQSIFMSPTTLGGGMKCFHGKHTLKPDFSRNYINQLQFCMKVERGAPEEVFSVKTMFPTDVHNFLLPDEQLGLLRRLSP